MNIKKLFLLATALYASHHNMQLTAMDQMPGDVLNLILSSLSMRSQFNFMQTARCYAKLHESNIPTHCSGCAINTKKEKIDVDGISEKIKNTSIIGLLTIKGCNKRIFNALSNQTLITDLQLLDFDILLANIQCPINNLSKNTIKTLKVGKSLPDGERIYVGVPTMTYLLKEMPHLESCVLSHVGLYCDDEDVCSTFGKLGEQLFRTKHVEIHNSSVGCYGLSWIQVALRESKTIKELTLNNIYTTQNRNYEEDNYTDPVVLTGAEENDQLLFGSACLCPTLQLLTLNNKMYAVEELHGKKVITHL